MSHLSSFPTEEPKTTKQKVLEAGASLLQSKEPIKSFKQHLMSVSHVAGNPNKQLILHHFLNAFNEDFAQALLYDGGLVDSKLVGVQYIISDKVYLTLPEEERKLWQPLQYMVKNGLLVAPSLPAMAEKPLMARLLSSFSKTFLFWDTSLNPLPLGIPQILSTFTADGQVNKTLSTNLLEAAEIKLAELIKRREHVDSKPSLLGSVTHPPQDVYQLALQRIGGPQNQNQMGGMGANLQNQMGMGGIGSNLQNQMGMGQMGQMGQMGGNLQNQMGGMGQMGQMGQMGGMGQVGQMGGNLQQPGMMGGYGNTPMTGQPGLAGATGTYGTGALAGATGAHGASGLTGQSGMTHGTTGLTGNPVIDNVAAGVLGHGHTGKSDVINSALPGSTSSSTTRPYHTDYTAQ